MKNTYKLTRTWRSLAIGPCVGILLIMLIVITPNRALMKEAGFGVFVLIWLGLVGLAYGTVSGKLITSPENIERIALGMRVQATWDKVERIDINPQGFVNLIFKEPLYKNSFINALCRPLGYDRTIQLSPFIDDLA